jgi:hypothetical protein
MSIHEQLSAQYLQWELRGRGWFVHPEPVAIEPPFQPFRGYQLHGNGSGDDARRSSFAERLLRKAGRWLNTTPDLQYEPEDTDSESEVIGWSRDYCHEVVLTFPKSLRYRRDQMESFLRMSRTCTEPISFEILADDHEIGFQWGCGAEDAGHLKACSAALFPDCVSRDGSNQLQKAWDHSGRMYAVAEIGLARDCLLSIETGKVDLLPGLLAAMSACQQGEMGLFQVIFEPASSPWDQDRWLTGFSEST